MGTAESKSAPTFDRDESIDHSHFDDAEALVCEGDEAAFPPIEDFDNVECDEPGLDAKVFELPSYILSQVAPDGAIIYMEHQDFPLRMGAHALGNTSRRQAQNAGAIPDFPEDLAIITLKKYSNAMTFNKNPDAHLQLIKAELVKKFEFRDGKLYYNDVDINEVEESECYDNTIDSISNTDLPILQCLYSVILHDIELTLKDLGKMEQMAKDPEYIGRSIMIYMRNFLKMMGYDSKSSYDTIYKFVKRVNDCGNVFGLIADGSEEKKLYPLVIFNGYDELNQTMRFASPYMHVLAINVLLSSAKLKKRSHSHLIKPSIAKKHNGYEITAFEIVCVVVRFIEQIGCKAVGIQFQTILERCPCLQKRIEKAGATNKGKTFMRAFETAWGHLRTNTRLTEKYKDIRLPNPNNPKDLPNYKDLSKEITFPHNGKIKNNK